MAFDMPPPGSLLFKPTTQPPTIQLNELDQFTLKSVSFVSGDTPTEVDPLTHDTIQDIIKLD